MVILSKLLSHIFDNWVSTGINEIEVEFVNDERRDKLSRTLGRQMTWSFWLYSQCRIYGDVMGFKRLAVYLGSLPQAWVHRLKGPTKTALDPEFRSRIVAMACLPAILVSTEMHRLVRSQRQPTASDLKTRSRAGTVRRRRFEEVRGALSRMIGARASEAYYAAVAELAYYSLISHSHTPVLVQYTPMSSSSSSIDFTITHRGQAHALSLAPDTTFADLQERIQELTNVLPTNQKILYKGKKQTRSGDEGTVAVVDAGLRSGMKVQVLGPTAEEIGELRHVEEEKKRKDQILRDRALKPQVKVRSTASPSKASDLRYRFHRIEPLQHLPSPASALSVLNKLAQDPAILHVMQKHQFAVGLLTELAPHEHPELLGLNENAGQAIKLRLRTNDYEGFRPYLDVRRVLCHELTHNKWGDHDNNFKELNSRLNREVVEFERAAKEGAHRLSSYDDVYQPASNELEAEAQAYVLGGGALGSTLQDRNESIEERRKRLLEATMNRLRKEEEELEQSCGTAGHSSDANNS
ncbi:hypothetical protein NM688_g2499 [Phlebia brevispora]|uniref:Uncharacterized protein n=1 Tax=Phlebia brevispora TaxID=194682 RepID=A0ACC1T8T4_9APHY|nr:hypothetical protein NM688_g2499 [Phlebia brevispora]